MLYWIGVSALWLCIIGVVIHLCVTHRLPEPGEEVEAEPEPTEFAADYDAMRRVEADKTRAAVALGRGHDGVEL